MTAARSEEPFDLRAVTRAAWEASGSADPALVADKILGERTDAECRLIAEVTLADYVRRSAGARFFRGAASDPVSLAPVSLASSRPRRVRDWYATVLAQPLFVGAEWKFLRDCTGDDVAAAATVRYDKAEASRAEGDRWAALAEAMRKRRAKTVADVPEDVLRSVLA